MHATTFIAVLIALLPVAVLVVPLAGEAQQAASLPRIGFLAPGALSEPRFPRFKVNVIVAGGAPAVQAAKQATETIPIVMVNVNDPVASGFVVSLARPGGNITGLSLMLLDLVGKQLGLLKEVVPKVSRVALLGNPANSIYATQVRHAQDAARALGVQLQPLEARDPSEIDSAFAAITTERAGAVIVLGDTVLLNHQTRIADHAVRRRLPTVFSASEYAEAGGLLAYGPRLSDGPRRAPPTWTRSLRARRRPTSQSSSRRRSSW